MQLKTFEAASLDEALRRVRAAFGPDALIIATDQSRKGGRVRVTAACEHHADAAAEPAPSNGEPVDDPIPLLRNALAECGVDGNLAITLLSGAYYVQTPVAPAVALAAALDSFFRFRPLTSRDGTGLVPHETPRRVMLVGPPGSGKTVTAAKLAARAFNSGNSVRTISIDTRKTGGAAHLEALARHLTLGMTVARTPDELIAATSGSQVDFTVIDSFGVNPFDAAEIDELGAFVDASGAEPLLVLPAGVEARDAQDMAAVFAELGCTRAVITRIDLTRRLGSLLNAFHFNQIGFCDVSVSPEVLPPESGGLRPLNPVALARLLLPDQITVSGGATARAPNARAMAS
jgi:flagellar biosynthesis protein FlhF